MILLVNYANQLYKTSQNLNSKTGIETGLFDKVISYSPQDIDYCFYKKNEHILNKKRGNGFWLWKPYFIKKTLETLNKGDFLFYCDSGAYFLKSVMPLVELSLNTGQDVIPFELKYIEKEWTKRDAFVFMDCDGQDYADTPQRLASFSLWRKSDLSMSFVEDLLRYSQDKRIITDMDNQCGLSNYPGFKDHRHDQSIFSLLSKKYNLRAFRNPAKKANYSNQELDSPEYPQIIKHTRRKDLPLLQKFKRKIIRANNRYFRKEDKLRA